MHERYAIFTVRYSVFSPSLSRSWRIGRAGQQEYLFKLFDPERLQMRRTTFSKITIPSLAAAIATCPQVKTEVHILTSTELPKLDSDFLHELANKYSFLRIFAQSPEMVSLCRETDRFCEALSSNALVASIRIDDDDAVVSNFLSLLSEQLRAENVGDIVSMSSGYSAIGSRDGTLIGPFSYRWRFGSCGQTLIRKSKNWTGPGCIYSAGNHMTNDERFPVIVDSREPAFLRLFHEGADTWTSAKAAYKYGEFSRSARDSFNIDKSLWIDPDLAAAEPGSATPSDASVENLTANLEKAIVERDKWKRIASARRSKIACWADCADYKIHRLFSKMSFMGDAFCERFRVAAKKRWRPGYGPSE